MPKSVKKTNKSSIGDDLNDFITNGQFVKSPNNVNNGSNRPNPEKSNSKGCDEDIELCTDKDKLLTAYETTLKNKRQRMSSVSSDATKGSQKKILDVISAQIKLRNKAHERLLKSLSNIEGILEAETTAIEENEQRLQHLTAAHMKCVQKSATVHKQILKAIKETHITYEKHVKGLISRGAMKPDERPLWFDVYRAFPPAVEPRFDRPKPAAEPIRPILYKEDVERAKIHEGMKSFAPVSMFNPSGETQTKRILKHYYRLANEGVPQDALVDQAIQAEALEIHDSPVEKKQKVQTKPITKINPASAIGQVLADMAEKPNNNDPQLNVEEKSNNASVTDLGIENILKETPKGGK